MSNTYRSAFKPEYEAEKPQIAAPLEGKRIELYVDGRPISSLRIDSEERRVNNVDRVFVMFETTISAIEKPDVSAKINAAMRGFSIGDSVGIRYPNGGRSGVMTIESLVFDETDAVERAEFKGKALTPIFRAMDDTFFTQANPGETLYVEPRFCERLSI